MQWVTSSLNTGEISSVRILGIAAFFGGGLATPGRLGSLRCGGKLLILYIATNHTVTITNSRKIFYIHLPCPLPTVLNHVLICCLVYYGMEMAVWY